MALGFSLVLGVAGCTDARESSGADSEASHEREAGPANEPTNASKEGHPPIKVVLAIEDVGDGRNQAREAYDSTVASCRKAGWPVKALADDQLAKLGTHEVTLAIDAGRRLGRHVWWTAESPTTGIGDLCQFTFREFVEEEFQGPGRVIIVSAEGRQELPAEEGGFAAMPVDVAAEQSATRAVGWSDAGERMVMGQPCREWTDADRAVRTCIWSAGAEWGITPVPSMDQCNLAPTKFFAGFPLERDQVSGAGCNIRVKYISVGTPLPGTEFALRKQGGAQG